MQRSREADPGDVNHEGFALPVRGVTLAPRTAKRGFGVERLMRSRTVTVTAQTMINGLGNTYSLRRQKRARGSGGGKNVEERNV